MRRAAALPGVAFTTTLHAWLVADGGILNLTAVANLAGDLTVGTNGGNTTLNIIGPGAAVTNANGRIGLNATSTDNPVQVQNSDAIWNNIGLLYVGDQGAGNAVVTTHGGTVAVLGSWTDVGAGTGVSPAPGTLHTPGELPSVGWLAR